MSALGQLLSATQTNEPAEGFTREGESLGIRKAVHVGMYSIVGNISLYPGHQKGQIIAGVELSAPSTNLCEGEGVR